LQLRMPQLPAHPPHGRSLCHGSRCGGCVCVHHACATAVGDRPTRTDLRVTPRHTCARAGGGRPHSHSSSGSGGGSRSPCSSSAALGCRCVWRQEGGQVGVCPAAGERPAEQQQQQQQRQQQRRQQQQRQQQRRQQQRRQQQRQRWCGLPRPGPRPARVHTSGE
jgi:hypothetical protein